MSYIRISEPITELLSLLILGGFLEKCYGFCIFRRKPPCLSLQIKIVYQKHIKRIEEKREYVEKVLKAKFLFIHLDITDQDRIEVKKHQ